ncbi:MAG TPA: hypothetical protein VFY71_08875 [Planctomycetota bacterium]|nr:hypothetical protein [Planctomycetota bacterium]
MIAKTARPSSICGSRPGGWLVPHRAASGFTFIEVLLGTLVLGTMLVTATTALTSAAVAQDQLVTAPVTAYSLAREIHSLALVLPRDAGDGQPAASGAAVLLLEDLDGASFNPPIAADRRRLTYDEDWTQQVAIEPVELGDPAQPAADATAAGTLLRLTVTVLQGSTERGSYVWWMSP